MLVFDAKDIFYLISGAAFFGLTVLPMISGLRLISVPTLYVAAGMIIAYFAPGLRFIDPMAGEGTRLLLEHLTELIVIVALAGAGLAVDRTAGRRSWQHTWVLLCLVMPVSILAVAWMGMTFSGLSLAAAVLLGGCLAPTDPVLARSVQVDGPNTGEEDDVRVSLTTEAGINDGLAFPVIWLAIILTTLTVSDGWTHSDWFLSWLGFDVIYRLCVACGIGWGMGLVLSRIVLSSWGDAANGGNNAGLVMLATTFLAYGATEAFEGYGFLAVFVAARAGRHYSRGTDGDDYVVMPHSFAEQVEQILLAILLLWLGAYAMSGILVGTGWSDVAIAILLIFVVRPLVGILALIPTRGHITEKFAIATFGIRGMGSIFYVAFAQGHGEFQQIEQVWRIVIITILISIVVHGALAPSVMRQLRRA